MWNRSNKKFLLVLQCFAEEGCNYIRLFHQPRLPQSLGPRRLAMWDGEVNGCGCWRPQGLPWGDWHKNRTLDLGRYSLLGLDHASVISCLKKTWTLLSPKATHSERCALQTWSWEAYHCPGSGHSGPRRMDFIRFHFELIQIDWPGILTNLDPWAAPALANIFNGLRAVLNLQFKSKKRLEGRVRSSDSSGPVVYLGHLGTSWDILGHLGTSWDILGHLGTSWDILGHLGTSRDISGRTSRDISGHLGTSRDISGHLGTSRDISGHLGTSRDISGHLGTSLGHLGTSWDILGHLGTSWDILGHLGTSWDILGHLGTSWDILGHLGTSWDILGLGCPELQGWGKPLHRWFDKEKGFGKILCATQSTPNSHVVCWSWNLLSMSWKPASLNI